MRIDDVKKPPTWVRAAAMGGGNGVDPVTFAEMMLENAQVPQVEEPAVTHPFTTSTVKVRNNGMIDAFVGTDQGIRIDPYTKTVNIIADGQKEHLGYFRAWINVDAEWYANSHFLFKSVYSSFNVDAKTDINQKCQRHKNTDVGINHTEKIGNNQSITVGNNENITVGNNETIKIGGNLDIVVGGTVNIKAGSTVTVNGSHIYLN